MQGSNLTAPKIAGFFGDFRFLSNFVRSPVVLDGERYQTVEHAYQAAKTICPVARKNIRLAATPADAKRMGKKVTMRADWEEVKEQVMLDLLKQKFSVEPFRSDLLATGNLYLEETNHWGDKYWGVSSGDGKNRLGQLLMQVRAEL